MCRNPALCRHPIGRVYIHHDDVCVGSLRSRAKPVRFSSTQNSDAGVPASLLIIFAGDRLKRESAHRRRRREMRYIIACGELSSAFWPDSCISPDTRKKRRSGKNHSSFFDGPAIEEIDQHLTECGRTHHSFGEIVQHDNARSGGNMIANDSRGGLGSGALQIDAGE